MVDYTRSTFGPKWNCMKMKVEWHDNAIIPDYITIHLIIDKKKIKREKEKLNESIQAK